MARSLPVLTALLWLCFTAAARAAPTGTGSSSFTGPRVTVCSDVKESSAMFNGVAREVSAQAREIIPNKGAFNTPLVWMEAKDMCDPTSLNRTSLPCVGKLLSVLEDYSSAVELVSNITICSALAAKVKPLLHNLHKELKTCVTSMGGRGSAGSRGRGSAESMGGNGKSHKHKMSEMQNKLLCRYVMERLFSFSIITARVFAEGDPAHHHTQHPHKCL